MVYHTVHTTPPHIIKQRLHERTKLPLSSIFHLIMKLAPVLTSFLSTSGAPGRHGGRTSKLNALPLDHQLATEVWMMPTETLSSQVHALTDTASSLLAQATTVFPGGAVPFGLWITPVAFYLRGYPLTAQFVDDLEKMDDNDPGYDPDFKPIAPQWENIEAIPGGKEGVLQHIKWGSPSLALYLAASFGLFPGHDSELLTKVAAALTIPAGILLAYCLIGAFRVLAGLYKQGAALFIATTLIVLTTLPFFQLISWEIEYALRLLLDSPTQTVLWDWYLTLVTKTNIFLPFFVSPLDALFSWDALPTGFGESGKAVVQSIVDANQYIQTPQATTPALLASINSGLLVQVLYGSLAIIPMWAVLTNFGFADVNTPFSRRAFSKAFLAIINKENWADEGIIGMVWLYWFLSFGWLMWGVAVNSAYLG